MRIALMLCCCTLALGTLVFGKTTQAPHVTVEHEGIDDAQAESIAGTLSAAYDVYVNEFKFDLPETVRCTVKVGPDQTRCFTDGVEQVTLLLQSKDQLRPPAEGNPFNLYAMCHEMGHMAMYRLLKDHDWLSSAGAEGWAHYAGSVVVDRVYEAKGKALWWAPYDYRADGTARLAKQLKQSPQDPTTRGAGEWQKLEKIIGREGFARVFAAWQSAGIDPFSASEKAGVVLAGVFPSKSEALKSWWSEAAPVLVKNRAKSETAKQEVKPAQLTGKATKIAPDDDTADGKRSIAGGGHARKFTVPEGGGEWYIVAISIHGQRYGPRAAPATQFDLALCETDLKPIVQWQRKYSEFSRDQMKWVRFAVTPTRVGKEFAVCASFKPTGSNGVYVAFDTSTSGKSLVGTPGAAGEEFEKGDWMIRVELDQLK